MDDIKVSSNRSFGIVFFIVFLLIATYPLLKSNDIRVWSLLISFGFLILGLINSYIGPSLKLKRAISSEIL